MKITAWRITKRKNAKTAFTGEGARLFGGRWNSPGTPIVYLAESQSLAALEMLVHLGSPELLDHYVVFEIGFGENLAVVVDVPALPRNWRSSPAPASIRAIGDDWARDAKSVVLRVPSALIPGENIYLVNPNHPDFSKVEIGKPSPFEFDPRLSE